MHMQLPTGSPGVLTPAAWEYALPNGRYDVTVSAGDQPPYDSVHNLRLEGVTVIDHFQGTAAQEYAQATSRVTVVDGKLTVDAIGGTNTKLNYVDIREVHPSVTGSDPVAGQTNVFRDASINIDVALPHFGYGVDGTTLSNNTVQLTRTFDGASVAGNVNTTGGDDAIVFQPKLILDSSTQYTLTVTNQVQDKSGSTFTPYTVSFTTGLGRDVALTPGVSFAKSAVYAGSALTSLIIGPDHKLYAASLDGILRRWTINADGSLGATPESYSGLSGRAIIGITFDPVQPGVLWISHNDTVYTQPANDFSSGISYLTFTPGSTAFDGTLTSYIVGLPRSAKDHVSNSLAFGPDGLLYMPQGSNTSMGASDPTWYDRSEHVLNAAILQIDPRRTTGLPINVQSENYTLPDGTQTFGNYDPNAVGAPVKVYASGLRNAFDLVWHTNGFLYAPTNGGASGGNTPASPPGRSPVVPAVANAATADDYLFRVQQGGYYGHPNSTRNEYVMNGGNPTSGQDMAEVVASGTNNGYPVGIFPEATYRGYAYDFGRNRSPDGAIEYKSNTFGGLLKGKLLVVEYSAGDDVLAITPSADGDVHDLSAVTQLASGFSDPLDIIEDTTNGNLYVTELINDGLSGGRITLLKPSPTLLYEAESLPVAGTSGDTHRILAESGFSAGNGTILDSDAVGDFVTYTVNVPEARTYNIRVAVKTYSTRGIFQLSANGVDVGSPQDTYGASVSFPELNLGNFAFPSPGNYAFKFRIVGKNAASTGYSESSDYIKLTPQ
ncbi:MAG: Ig-like domain-containing protein [Verrucomicrobiota bacterium]|nr:Ig-like domain-containing protein [Verrucomicrobiota bacterium]